MLCMFYVKTKKDGRLTQFNRAAFFEKQNDDNIFMCITIHDIDGYTSYMYGFHMYTFALKIKDKLNCIIHIMKINLIPRMQ